MSSANGNLIFNYCYSPDAEQIVLVEGPADAITLAEWRIPAIALMGLEASEALLHQLRQTRYVFVMLDNEDKTRRPTEKIAAALRKNAYIPRLANGIKDVNQWLVEHHGTAQDMQSALNVAQSWLAHEIQKVSHLDGLARDKALRQLFAQVTDLDTVEMVQFQQRMGKIGVKGSAFTAYLKAASQDSRPIRDSAPRLLADDVPVLSPALGFHQDLAMVTVALTERTSDNRLIHWPYLVTNRRELMRLTHDQVLSIDRTGSRVTHDSRRLRILDALAVQRHSEIPVRRDGLAGCSFSESAQALHRIH